MVREVSQQFKQRGLRHSNTGTLELTTNMEGASPMFKEPKVQQNGTTGDVRFRYGLGYKAVLLL